MLYSFHLLNTKHDNLTSSDRENLKIKADKDAVWRAY